MLFPYFKFSCLVNFDLQLLLEKFIHTLLREIKIHYTGMCPYNYKTKDLLSKFLAFCTNVKNTWEFLQNKKSTKIQYEKLVGSFFTAIPLF
jgi:hypothetical protein